MAYVPHVNVNIRSKFPNGFLPKQYDKTPYSVDAPGYAKVEGETIPRRLAGVGNGELQYQPEAGISTTWDIVVRGAAKFGDIDAVGSRKLLHTHEEMIKTKKMVDGVETEVEKKWTYFESGPYTWKSFTTWKTRVEAIGSAYRKLGLVKGDAVYIYATTSENWLATAHGAASQSMPVVTAYDTLGEAAIRHALLATSPKLVFLEPHLIPVMTKTLKDANVMAVVYNDANEVIEADLKDLKDTHGHLEVLSFTELLELGQKNVVPTVPPQPDETCCIMYTSGTSGDPKGVVLTHKNVVAALAGIMPLVGVFFGPGDIVLGYLPAAHIFEFMFENASFFWGSAIGFGNAKTLSDASMRNCKGDIRELRPTVLIGVPAIWEGIRKGIVAKIDQASPLLRNVFWAAYNAKSWCVDRGLPGLVFWDSIFAKVRDATGGRLRVICSGAGPISHSTQRFLSLAITPMLSGYGMTESTAMGALTSPMRWSDTGSADIPASVEIKLVDFPDASYYTTNNPPQGEVWVRGHSIASGYFNDPEETSRAFIDGWFRTGDIGEFTPSGQLRIIDRMKNLVKTQNGEYIALEKLESIYRTAPIVFSICVFASIDQSRPVAIIVPAEPALIALAKANNIPIPDHVADLRDDPKMVAVALKEIIAAGKKGGLGGIEILVGLVIVHEEWTPQTGFLTSAMKLKRRTVVDHYKKGIDRAYGKRD